MSRSRVRDASAWLCLAVAILSAACVSQAPVVQGKVLSVDKAARTITIREEDGASGAPRAFDIGRAEVGAQPEVGDQVRLAYRVVGEKNIAIRVMNLTQQEKREKRGA